MLVNSLRLTQEDSLIVFAGLSPTQRGEPEMPRDVLEACPRVLGSGSYQWQAISEWVDRRRRQDRAPKAVTW